MSPEERRRRGGKLCEKLGIDVAEIVPEGIGQWDECWNIVGDADVAFVVALTAWEATGLDEQRDTVKAAYHSLLEAWREAARQYEQQRQRAS
jgi:hypothetical protein